MNGVTTMLMKICIAAAVALGCTLAVPSASFAAGDQDKSATTDKSKPSKPTHHKKAKKGFSDTAHENASYDRPEKPKH